MQRWNGWMREIRKETRMSDCYPAMEKPDARGDALGAFPLNQQLRDHLMMMYQIVSQKANKESEGKLIESLRNSIRQNQ